VAAAAGRRRGLTDGGAEPVMAGADARRVGVGLRAWLVLVAASCISAALGQDSAAPLDPIQRAVVDSLDASLTLPGGTTPESLLDAALKASGVDAAEAAENYLAMLATLVDKAGAAAPDMLANLADATDEAALMRLDRAVRARQPAAGTFRPAACWAHSSASPLGSVAFTGLLPTRR
jgi:hypothetical protein